VILLLLWWPAGLVIAGGTACAIAEYGRRKHGGRTVFPATSALWAPAWLLERAVCVWLAVCCRILGGVRYTGELIPRAATPPAVPHHRQAASR
jgi:hypothetical protein